MSSEDIFGEEEHELSLEFADILEVVQFIIKNNHSSQLNDGTLCCFQMFHDVVEEYSSDQSFCSKIDNLPTISHCIKQLQHIGKFDNFMFATCVLNSFLALPLEFVWWLQSNDIMTIAEYCKERKPDVVSELIDLFGNNRCPEIFNVKCLTRDVLNEFICGAYAPRLGICRLSRSKLWSDYARMVLDQLADKTVQTTISNDGNKSFMSYLSFFTGKQDMLSGVYSCFFASTLNKFMTLNPEEFDINMCYKYQYLFQNIPENFTLVFNRIFKYLDIDEVFKIVESNSNVNWKYVCYAFNEAIQQDSNRRKFEEKVVEYLDTTFKGGKVKELMKAFIFVRQACVAAPGKSYRKWYTDTFGTNTNYKTSSNATCFKYFLECLTGLIEFEGKETLEVHVDVALKAPPKCNSLIFDYKVVARAQLQNLAVSPVAILDEHEVPVLHLLEDCKNRKEITPFMKKIISQQGPSFVQALLQQTETEDFVFVRSLLLENML